MKSILYRLLSIALLAGVAFMPSCRRIIDLPAPTTSSSGDVVVRDNVFVLDSLNNNLLVELKPEYLVIKDSPKLRNGRIAGSINFSDLKKGDIVLGYSSLIAPAGFAAKIVSISKQGVNTRIDYERPKLLEIFQKMDTTIVIPVYGLTDKFSFDFPVKSTKNITSVSGTGSLSIAYQYEPEVVFRFLSDEYLWKERSIVFRIKKTISSTCSIAGAVSIADSKNFACKNFTPKPLPLPLPVPIYITPVFRVDGDISLSAEVVASGEWAQTTQSTVFGFASYNEGEWKTVDETKEEPVTFNPNIAVNGKIEAGLSASFDFFLYQFFEVDCKDKEEIRLSANLKLRALLGLEGSCKVTDKTSGLEVKGYAGLEVIASLKAKLFGVLEAEPSDSKRITFDLPTLKVNAPFCKADSIDPTKDPIIPTEVFEGGTSFGDPNLVTFDGKPYGFNGAGEFVAVKSTTDNFEIQVRQEELKNRSAGGSVSWNTGLAITTGSDRLCFYPNKYFINGTQYAYNANINHTLAGGGNVSGDNRTITVSNSTGDLIKVFNEGDMLNYSVIPNIQRQGKMIGLFGDYNKDQANDLKLRNGTPIDGSDKSLYPTFTDSWRIAQAQSLFIYDAGKNTNSYTDRNFPRSPLVINASQRASAEQTCKNAGVVSPFLEGCINDVVATGSVNSAQWAKALQEETVLRSFDIKFGEKEDKSMYDLRQGIFGKSLEFGENHLLFKPGLEDLTMKHPIVLTRNFETTFYYSTSKYSDVGQLSIGLSPNYDVTIHRPFLTFDILKVESLESSLIDYIIKDDRVAKIPLQAPHLFDGKIHKVYIKYIFNSDYTKVSREVFIDNFKISELKDVQIEYNPLKINYIQIYNRFPAGDSNVGKLYRWSFKSL